jgi:hypothetical protein
VIARVAGAAIVVALAATACGGHSKRDAVVGYLQLVNTTENGLAGPLKEVSSANQAFAKKQSNPRVEGELLRAEQTMHTLRGRLAAIAAPPEAHHLQALLLELVDREVGLTQEVYAISKFLPRYDAELQALAPADAALKRVLTRSAKGAAAAKALDAEKASALTSYAATIGRVITSLRTIDPPAVWRPAYENQLAALGELRSDGIALAEAISGKHAAAVPGLLRRFDEAALADQSVAAQKQQIAAVDAYNRQVSSLIGLARSVERERNRLQRVTT